MPTLIGDSTRVTTTISFPARIERWQAFWHSPGELLHRGNGELHEVLLPRSVQAELKELVRQHVAVGFRQPVHESPVFEDRQHSEYLAVRLADPQGDRRQVLAFVAAGQVLDDVEPLLQCRRGVLRLATHAGSRPSRFEEPCPSCATIAGRGPGLLPALPEDAAKWPPARGTGRCLVIRHLSGALRTGRIAGGNSGRTLCTRRTPGQGVTTAFRAYHL